MSAPCPRGRAAKRHSSIAVSVRTPSGVGGPPIRRTAGGSAAPTSTSSRIDHDSGTFVPYPVVDRREA
ncbi:hypothetical protein AB0O67_16980 [Streptomyces sp. NPDC086077]|uniref:hypothetical protein n=1 Tax=Streptomyces sp. NPDC086077 TaxID=3154862 RepID=UPI00342BD4D3